MACTPAIPSGEAKGYDGSAGLRSVRTRCSDREDTMGLTREIGEFVTGMRYERVPADAVETVARGFTDCVGVMLAGLAEPVASVVAKSVGLAGPVARVADFGETGL